jgi:ketosteroid isomerase-like protein
VSELAIRSRRAAFNRAIADGDAAAIGPLLARDCVMVTGTDSAVIAGRMAQVKVWRREFGHSGRMVYVRTSESVAISSAEPIAMEHGRWYGTQGGSEIPGASGTYAAKWREVAGEWVIEAEIFVTFS